MCTKTTTRAAHCSLLALRALQAWYRCTSSPPIYPMNNYYSAPAIPTGVFMSRQEPSNLTMIQSEFSHSSVQLCGTAARVENGVTTYAEFVRACTVPFASTMGTWVHGAMVFDAISGNMTFYLNGVAQPIGTTTGASAWAGYLPTPPDILNVFYSASTLGNSYLSAGTAVDNLRAWQVARSGSDIASTWNSPLVGNEVDLIMYLSFSSPPNSNAIYALFVSPTHGGYNLATVNNGATAATTASPTSCGTPFRSCSRKGCAPLNNNLAGFDNTNPCTGDAASSTAVVAAASSSGSVGASSSTGSGGCPAGVVCAAHSARTAGWGILVALAAIAVKMAL